MVTETAKTRVEIDGQDAEANLKKLRGEAKELNAELERTKKANDLAGWEKTNAALKENTARQKELRTALKDVNAVMKNLSGSSLTDLTRAQRQLNNELKHSTQNTLEEKRAFEQKAAQLQKVDAQIAKTRAQMKGMGVESQGFFGKMNDGLNKYGMMAATVIASITGLSLAFNKLNNDAMDREDSKANLSALTGLEGADLDWLAKEADKLSTTTTEAGVRISASSRDILDAYTLMGSAKPELLENKEALAAVTKEALTLAAAAKMQTGPAVEGLAKAMNQYGAGADQANRYVNVLAAGSKFGAVGIESISTSVIKSGTAASTARIPIEQLVGSIEALGDKGITDEIAGTGLKTFFLKLISGADETNPKIVGLSQALETLAKKNMSAAEMVKMFGLENYTVAQTMINNRAQVDKYTEAVTGTNVAYEQAIKNTSTTRTKLAQSRNEFALTAQSLATKLSPAINSVTVTATKFVKVLVQLPVLLARYGPTLLAAGAAFAAYGVAMNASIVLDKLKIFWTNNVIASFNRMKVAMMTNPWTAAAAGVALLAAGMVELVREYRAVNNPHRDFINDLSKEKSALNDAFEAVRKTTPGTKERAAAINVVNEQYGQYLPKLLTEKSSLEEIATAQNAATNALIANIATKNSEAELNKIGERSAKSKTQLLSDYYNLIADTKGYEAAENAEREFLEISNQMMALREKGGRENYIKSLDLADQLAGKYGENAKQTRALVATYTSVRKWEQQDLDRTKKFYDAYINSVKGAIAVKKEVNKTPEVKGDGNDSSLGSTDEATNKKNAEKALKAIDEEFAKQRLQLAKDYQERKITKEQQTVELLMLDVAYEEARLLTAQKYGVDIIAEETKLVDARQKLIDHLAAADDKQNADMLARLDATNKSIEERMFSQAEIEFKAQVTQWEREDKAQEDRAAKKLENAKRQADEQKAIFEQTGAAFGELIGQQIAGQELSAENFGKTMLLIALDTLHGIVRMAIAQTWAGALASPESIATWGAAGVTKALAMSAIIEGAFAVAKAAVTGSMKQKATGDYTVIGATDGKTYHAPYSGAAKTGYYPSPTLISEQGGEVVIDAPTVRNIRMNSPHILSSIMAMRVPQRAAGAYSAAGGGGGSASSDPELKALIRMQAGVIASLNQTLANGIKADMSYSNVKSKLDKVAAIDAKVSKK